MCFKCFVKGESIQAYAKMSFIITAGEKAAIMIQNIKGIIDIYD